MSCISTRGLEKQSLCNVQKSTCRNLIYYSCSESYANLKKKKETQNIILNIFLLHILKQHPERFDIFVHDDIAYGINRISSRGCGTLEKVKKAFVYVSEQPDLAVDVPVHSRRVGLDDL